MNGELYPIVVLGLAALLAFLAYEGKLGGARDERLAGAARRLGLDLSPTGKAGGWLLKGRLKGFTVEVWSNEDARQGTRTVRLMVSGKALPSTEVRELTEEKHLAAALRLPGESPAWLSHRQVDWVKGDAPASAGELVDWVEAVVAAAEAVSRLPVARLLAERAKADPDPEVRKRCLSALVEEYPDAAEASEALAFGLADESPQVRLAAAGWACRLGQAEKGTAVLERLLEDRDEWPQLRSRALEALVGRLPADRLREALDSATRGPAALAQRAVQLALQSGEPSLLPRVRDLAGSPITDDGLAVALVRYLGRFGEAGDEPSLLKLLSEPSEEIRLAVIDELRRTGTVRCVEPLLALQPVAVRDKARDAVRAIQARLGDADAGRLSVVDTTASEGAVSVSLQEPKAGGERNGGG